MELRHTEEALVLTAPGGLGVLFAGLSYLPPARLQRLVYRWDDGALEVDGEPGLGAFGQAVLSAIARVRAAPHVPAGLGVRPGATVELDEQQLATRPLELISVNLPVIGALQLRMDPQDTLTTSLGPAELAVRSERGLLLAASYSLGMAMVYTAMGVAAGLAGEGLAAALQNPWVLGAFALMLAGFSLSMFGVYQLQLPASLQAKASETSGRFQGGRVLGVFAMGGLSALIVGPCVAAPLAGALVYISQTRDVLVGGVALFSLACGMSVPLLLVGVSAGSLLPRAGGWMEHVKHAFGVMLLAVAIWMVSPVLPGWALMALVGALLVITAVYLGAFERLPDARGWPRLVKGVGVLFALVGAVQFLGLLSGGRDVLQPLSHLAQRRGAAEPDGALAQAGEGLNFRRVSTVAELDAAVAAAGKPVMLDFYADWCTSCKEYEKFTFRDARVQQRLRDVVLLQADVTANNEHHKALLKRFQLFGPPGLVFFDPQGREKAEARVLGYQSGDQFLESLKAAAL